MESLDMFEPVSGLEDLVQILETLFADSKVFVRLEMQEERGETVHDHLLAQFSSTFDMVDVVQSEAEEDVALEFMFREAAQENEAEPRLMTLPIDPQDVEVDLFEEKVVLASGSFTLTIHRVTGEQG